MNASVVHRHHVETAFRAPDALHARSVVDGRALVVAGVRVEIDLASVLVLGLAAWTFSTTVLPDTAPGLSPLAYWLAGAAGAFMVLSAAALHEAGHCLALRRAGITVQHITLSPFGGTRELSREPASLAADVAIALAGPVANLAGAVVLGLADLALVGLDAPPVVSGIVTIGVLANVGLALLNVVPAPPLDGGRVAIAALRRLAGRGALVARGAERWRGGLTAVLVVVAMITSATGDVTVGLWTALLALAVHQAEPTDRARTLRSVERRRSRPPSAA